MSTTFTLPFASRGAAGALALTEIPAAEFNSGTVNLEGTETSYKHLVGDPALPTSARIGTYPPNKAGMTNRSVKLSTNGIKTDGDGVETSFGYTCTIAESDGSNGRVDPADRAAIIMMTVSMLLRGVGVDDEASTNVLQRLVYGENNVLHVTHS